MWNHGPMSAAHARRQDPHAVTSAPRAAAPRPRVVTGGGQRIRWDRVGRMAILVVFVVVALLYVGPVASILSARGEATTRRAQVEELRKENASLRKRQEGLRNGAALEVEARQRGMVKLGERPFVVEGLPKGP